MGSRFVISYMFTPIFFIKTMFTYFNFNMVLMKKIGVNI